MCDRRTLLAAVPVAAAALTAAAGCSSSDSGSSDSGSGGSTPQAGAGTDAGGAAGIDASTVPVGGALVIEEPAPIVVAQPEAGTFVAHSAVCTHQGGVVTVNGLTATCSLHGSEFNAATGAVEQGPAGTDLPAVTVTNIAGRLTFE